MTLQEKINYEFQCFFLDLMRTSKENIFAHSAEIEIKKKLIEELKLFTENADEAAGKVLILQNNLLESLYCFYKDMEQKKGTDDLGETVKDWQKFLLQKRRQLEKQMAKGETKD